MKTITVTTHHNGEVTNVLTKEITDEQASRFRERMSSLQASKQARLKEKMDNIDPMVITILKDANKMVKDDLRIKYPNHLDIIDRIK